MRILKDTSQTLTANFSDVGLIIGLTIDALRIQVRVKTVGATPGVITRAVYNPGYIQ